MSKSKSVETTLSERMDQFGSVKLDLGCGPNKKSDAHIGIDIIDYPGVDFVGDVFLILDELPESSVDEVNASHFFEHFDNIAVLLSLIHRCLRPGGQIICTVPHFSNPYFYSDPTHKTFFGLYSFSYFMDDSLFRRRVPRYKYDFGLTLTSVDLFFKAPKPFYISYLISRILGIFFNHNNMCREIYEGWFSSIFSCYEIKFVIEKTRA
jgi:SAM-dependent methyltransferase